MPKRPADSSRKPQSEPKPGKTIQSKTGVRKLYKAMREKYAGRIELSFFLQDWEDAYNVGSMFRLAEGLGANELILTGRTPQPDESPMVPVTSMGQHRRVPYRHFDRYDEAAKALIDEGWTLVAVEVADNAIDYLDAEFPDRTCLVLGNEGGGVYGQMMKHCAFAVYIPMFGKGRSLNVTHAAAVVAHQAVLGQKR